MLCGFRKCAGMLRADNRKGFTLIEMCVVLMISGIILIGLASLYRVYLKKTYIDTTNERLTTIRKAMQTFWTANGRLPCPADPSQPTTSVTYQKEVPCSAGDAISTTIPPTYVAGTKIVRTALNSVRNSQPPTVPGPPVAPNPEYLDATGALVRIGAVPTRALGLADDYYAEPNNHLFIYAVTESLTNSTTADLKKGAIEAVDAVTGASMLGSHGSTPFPGSALYLVISPGRDGIGSYTRAGIQSSPCTGVVKDVENCNGDTVFAGGTSSYSEN